METAESRDPFHPDEAPPPARPWGHRLALGVSVLALGSAVWMAWEEWTGGTRALAHQAERRDELAARIDRLQARVEAQRALAERLETDDALLERIAREKLGYIRPGERVFRFPEE
jgi:cell division protein FtsB